MCHKGGNIKHFMACCDGGVLFKESKPDYKSHSDEEIKEMALDMIFQMTGDVVPKDMRCHRQGDSKYQIAVHYLTKVREEK